MDMNALETCEPWPLDPACLPEDWPTDPAAVDRIVGMATRIARAYSADAVGRCRYTVRPCKPPCDDPCDGPCSCGRVCQIDLGRRDITCVEAIYTDGDRLPATAWRLYNRGIVILTEGRCWPRCQRLDRDLSQPGTWGIRYVVGDAPDDLAVAAMTAIAVEIASWCGRDCGTPRRDLTSLAVDGASYQFDTDAARREFASLPQVAAWMDVVNPYRARRRLLVVDPDDLPVYVETGQVHWT